MLRASVVATVIVLTVLLVACGARTAGEPSPAGEPPATSAASTSGGDPAALMARARALATRTSALEGRLWEGHLMTALIATDADESQAELAKAGALLGDMRANERRIAALLDQVGRLDAGEELRTYAGQQEEIAGLRLLGMVRVGEFLQKLERRFQEQGRPSEADIETLFAELESSDPDDPLSRLEEKGQASREYFRASGLPERFYLNNGLGEAYDMPAWQSEEEAGAFPVADEVRIDGPMVSEEVPPAKMWGSFATSVAEAMRAQRSVLEGEGWTVTVGAADDSRGVITARNSFWRATLTFEKAGGGRGRLVVRMTEL